MEDDASKGDQQPLVKGKKAPNYLRNALAFILLGTINNLSYCVVGAGAKSLASSFPDGQLGFITFGNVASGFICRGVNAFMLENTSFSSRIVRN